MNDPAPAFYDRIADLIDIVKTGTLSDNSAEKSRPSFRWKARMRRRQRKLPIMRGWKQQTGQDFIGYTMANRNATNKRLKIGDLSEDRQNLINERFECALKDITTDTSGIIHAMEKKEHNLEPDDLLHAVDVINTAEDVTLSPKKHQNNKVLVFKKDINGELTILAEIRSKYGHLTVFDAWRKEKARRHPDAVVNTQPPGTHVLNASPPADTPLSDGSANLSTPQNNAEKVLFQLTREGELEAAREAIADGRGREEFIADQTAYSEAMDEAICVENTQTGIRGM
jgi:hypothetical protein